MKLIVDVRIGPAYEGGAEGRSVARVVEYEGASRLQRHIRIDAAIGKIEGTLQTISFQADDSFAQV